MSDILTMMWKESKDVFFQGGWRWLIRPLIVIALIGVYLPLQFGPQWLDLPPLGMLLLLWVPFYVIISFIGDVIAGERERHTLETLLASRMPDRAILLGKVVTTVLYSWGMGVLGLLLGLVLVDLFRTQGNWMFYPLDLFVDAIVLSLLVSLLGASAGVLISLRVATVRQAQQILSVGTIVLVFGSCSCAKSRARGYCRIAKLFAVFAHCNGGYCRAGCDLAWIITGLASNARA